MYIHPRCYRLPNFDKVPEVCFFTQKKKRNLYKLGFLYVEKYKFASLLVYHYFFSLFIFRAKSHSFHSLIIIKFRRRKIKNETQFKSTLHAVCFFSFSAQVPRTYSFVLYFYSHIFVLFHPLLLRFGFSIRNCFHIGDIFHLNSNLLGYFNYAGDNSIFNLEFRNRTPFWFFRHTY